METIRLGKTEMRVSRVGFGGIPIQRLSEVEAVRVVQRCLDLGITFLDTANGYTTSEERIGKAIAGRREQVVTATKTAARDRATAQEHLELSLRRLHADAIDLWQFHNVSSFEAYERVLGPDGAMEAAQEALRRRSSGRCESGDQVPDHLPIREMLTENLAFYDQVISRARRIT